MIDVKPITAEEVPAFRKALMMGFGEPYSADGEEQWKRVMPLERTLAAFDGDRMVATFGDFELRMATPGGQMHPIGGTTMVTVAATHRRRGLLRRMMDEHLNLVRTRGESFAALWASESAIYGRFGFGVASEYIDLTFDARSVQLGDAPDDVVVDFVEAEQVLDVVAPFWSDYCRSRPGSIDRDSPRWQNYTEGGAKPSGGATAMQHIVARRTTDDGGEGPVIGYANYRLAKKWTDAVPDGKVEIEIVLAEDHDAHRALWAFLTHIDLFPHIHHEMAPVDEPMWWHASESRLIRRIRADALHLRILDLEGGLTGRSYEADGTIVMRVIDSLGYCDDTVELSITGGEATVTSTTAEPDVTLDVRELGTIYLGGFGAAALWRTGRIEAGEASALLLDQLFRTHQPPYCTEDF